MLLAPNGKGHEFDVRVPGIKGKKKNRTIPPFFYFFSFGIMTLNFTSVTAVKVLLWKQSTWL